MMPILLNKPKTVASVLCLVPALLLNTAGQTTAQTTGQINSDEILRAHNQWRQNVGSPPLRWSNQLAGVAQNWADRLAREGTMYHSSSGYGENIFSISGRRATGKEAVDSWGSEIQYFQNGLFPNVSTTGNWADVGHYTQVVWSQTTQVGCGVSGSARFEVWVCNYDPPGNVTGRSPFGQNQQQPSVPPAPLPPPTFPSTPSSSGGFFWDRQLTGAAVPAGRENNRTLYGCRAAYQGGLHPGKIIDNQCNFGFGGQELRSPNYEVLSFQGQSNGYRWAEALGRGEQPVLGGQEANGTSLYVCRASYQGGIHPGKLINGRCNIGYGGREIQLDRYETLVSQGLGTTQPTNPSNPTNSTNPTFNTGFYWENQLTSQSFAVGVEGNQTLYSCRVAYQGGLHPGKLLGNQCNFGFAGKEIQSRSYQVLSFSGSTRYVWEPANSSNVSQSLIGGQEASGTPLAICRASYGGGVHPGKVVGNQCNIGYGGREVELRTYEVLRLN